MKKLLLLFACSLATLMGNASETKYFTDELVVSVNGVKSTQTTEVSVEMLEDNAINFLLNNFVLKGDDENDMPVGNIAVNDLFLNNRGSYQSFSYNGSITISEGTLDGYDMWIGPLLGEVPLVLNGQIAGDKIYVSIDIEMVTIEQIISVKFGKPLSGDLSVVGEKTITKSLTASLTDSEGTTTFDAIAASGQTVQTLANGNLALPLKDLTLTVDGETLYFGSMTIPEIELNDRGSYQDFTYVSNITVEAGSEGPEWEAAGLTGVASVKGKYQGDQLYYTLNLNFSSLGTEFDLVFGSDFAIPAVTGSHTYDDKLVVSVNDEQTEPMDARVTVEKLDNGGINFALKNFTMALGDDDMHVGNILVEDLPLYEGLGYQYFRYNGQLTITAGNEEGVPENEYVGPLLGEIPLTMKGRLTDDKLYVTIDIYMETLNQVIQVTFGDIIMADAIKNVTVPTTASDAIYDLSGHRVQHAGKGIYIINGKKVLR